MQNIRIKNSLDACVIDIEGVIGVAEDWQFENAGERVATYEKFRESVAQIEALEATQVVVNIRSTGGDVNDALLIYEALCSLGIPITTRCYGYIASAATVIAQAASQGMRQISANALYLVHNSTCATEGNSSQLISKAELLTKTDERLAELYARRSGRDKEEFVALMGEDGGDGRWLTAQETIEAGLADTVIDTAATQSGDQDQAIKNFWRRLGAKLGITPTDAEDKYIELPQNDHSILHSLGTDEFGMSSQAQKATSELQAQREMQSAQAGVSATQLKQVEDPSLSEVTPCKNQKAYSDDVQAFRR